MRGHRAMIHDRGGARRLFDLQRPSSIEWTRRLNETSEASVLISARNCEGQADALGGIRSRRHELVIFRGEERVWEGPIREVSWRDDGVEIHAQDLKEYLDGDVLSKAWPNEGGGGPRYMTDRIAQILDYELFTPYAAVTGSGIVTVPRWETLDPPINLYPNLDIRSGQVLTRVSTEPFQMTIGEHLDRLAESGMDWTTVGRSLLIWDSADPIGRTRTLTEQDFHGEVTVYESGADYAAIAHVVAEDEEAEEDAPKLVIGSDGAADEYYGIWTHLATDQSESGESGPTQAALNSQAYRQRLWRARMPLEIRVASGAGITLNETLRIGDLVAGVEVPVRATLNLREVSQVQRLEELSVSENDEGEQISVTLKPSGPAMIEGE